MDKIINKFLLTGNKFMSELHLKQPRFTYSACGSFTKHCERIQKFRETGNSRQLYRIELDKACFAHNAAYSDSKGLAKRTISDKILKCRNYEIPINQKFDGYQRTLVIMVYKFFDKKTGLCINVNEQLGEELHKRIIKEIIIRKVCGIFKDNIWKADLAEMESLPSKNKNVKRFLCVIDVFTKYAWVKSLKDKKGKTVLNAFIEILNE